MTVSDGGQRVAQIGAGVSVDAFIQSCEAAAPGLAGVHRLGPPRAVDARQPVALVLSEVLGDFVGRRRMLLGHQSISGWRGHQRGRGDFERDGEPAHGRQARLTAGLEALNGVNADARQLGQLALRNGQLGTPVAQAWGGDQGGARCHGARTQRSERGRRVCGRDCHKYDSTSQHYANSMPLLGLQ